VAGVRYVQAALAYPRERKARGKSLAVGAAPLELLQLYDAATDTFAPQLSAQWSDVRFSVHPLNLPPVCRQHEC
jgi:hypothetical protein